MEGLLKGRLKEILKDAKVFSEKQNYYVDKSISLNKEIKKKITDNPKLTYKDFKEELTSIEKYFFYSSLLAQNTSKYHIQLSMLYQLAKLEKIDLELPEEDKSFLDFTVESDFDLFRVDKGEVKIVNNDYMKSINENIEKRSEQEREEHFKRMITDPNFQSLEV